MGLFQRFHSAGAEVASVRNEAFHVGVWKTDADGTHCGTVGRLFEPTALKGSFGFVRLLVVARAHYHLEPHGSNLDSGIQQDQVDDLWIFSWAQEGLLSL